MITYKFQASKKFLQDLTQAARWLLKASEVNAAEA